MITRNRMQRLFTIFLACCLLPMRIWAAPSQLEAGTYNNVRETGQWELLVPGRCMVCTGIGELPWSFCFLNTKTGENMDSILAGAALPVTEEMQAFQRNWLHTAQYLEACANSYFGELLTFISFDQVFVGPDDSVYVMYMNLEDERRHMEVTVCYRFLQSYYAVYLGINTGDMPEMFALTKRAASLFTDETTEPLSAHTRLSYRSNIEDDFPWQLPVLNVFSTLQDYTKRKFADADNTALSVPEEESGKASEDPDPELHLASSDPYGRTQRLLQNKDAVGDNIQPAPFERDNGVYLIKSAQDLWLLGKLIAQQVTFRDGPRAQFACYRLENDLDLSAYKSGWTPIGQMVWGGISNDEQYLAFSGDFDGNGKTITGLTVRKGRELMFYGLFGYITFAEIHDLNIRECDVRGGSSTGAVAGGGFSTWCGDQQAVRRCHVTGKVQGEGGTGGVVGVATVVEDCSFTGSVKSVSGEAGADQMTGGIVGSSILVRGCRADAEVEANGMVGGVTGLTNKVLASCFFGSVTGYDEVGGVAGYAQQITGSYCAGSVSGSGKMGGLAGTCNRLLSHSIMAGPHMELRTSRGNPGNAGRICGGISAGMDMVFACGNIALSGGSFSGSALLDGETIEAEKLLLPETWEALRIGTVDLWKPTAAGCYPQLAWETGDPLPIA